MTKLIGITGLKGSGKDTFAGFLGDGWEVEKFAGALKEMIIALLEYQGVDNELICRMIEGDLKEVPSPYLSGKTPRYAMQTLGTQWGRDIMKDDFWVDIAAMRADMLLSNGYNVVMTDVRFENEIEMIKDRGGKTLRINRDLENNDTHESEAAILNLNVDVEIDNTGDIESLSDEAEKWK